MIEGLLNKHGIKQLGYYVDDLERSAQLFRSVLGCGPFVDLGIAEPEMLRFRGSDSAMRSRCALGYLGDMQIELIEVQTEEPDVYKELGHYGLHHICIWVDDVDQVVEDFAEAGIGVAMEMISGQGLKVVYFDAREALGSFIEVNAPLVQLGEGIKALAQKDDGSMPALIPLQALMG